MPDVLMTVTLSVIGEYAISAIAIRGRLFS